MNRASSTALKHSPLIVMKNTPGTEACLASLGARLQACPFLARSFKQGTRAPRKSHSSFTTLNTYRQGLTEASAPPDHCFGRSSRVARSLAKASLALGVPISPRALTAVIRTSMSESVLATSSSIGTAASLAV